MTISDQDLDAILETIKDVDSNTGGKVIVYNYQKDIIKTGVILVTSLTSGGQGEYVDIVPSDIPSEFGAHSLGDKFKFEEVFGDGYLIYDAKHMDLLGPEVQDKVYVLTRYTKGIDDRAGRIMSHDHISIFDKDEFKTAYKGSVQRVRLAVDAFYERLGGVPGIRDSFTESHRDLFNVGTNSPIVSLGVQEIFPRYVYGLFAKEGPEAIPLMTVENKEEVYKAFIKRSIQHIRQNDPEVLGELEPQVDKRRVMEYLDNNLSD